jgi:hypothetical protein
LELRAPLGELLLSLTNIPVDYGLALSTDAHCIPGGVEAMNFQGEVLAVEGQYRFWDIGFDNTKPILAASIR